MNKRLDSQTMRPIRSQSDASEWATHWAQHWFLDERGEDRFRIGDIEAGWATHVEAYLILRAFMMKKAGLNNGLTSVAAWLKSRGLDRGIRDLGLRLQASSGSVQAGFGAVVEIPTPSMMLPASLVVRASAADIPIAVADPRVARRLVARGHRIHLLRLPWITRYRLLHAAGAIVRRSWKALIAAPPPMPFGNADLGPEALTHLHPLASRSMPYLAAESAAVEEYLDRTGVKAVAIASDQHRIGRLTVAAARRRGVETIVLQHGLPQARIGYLPVVADKVASWSEASREWFLHAGTPPNVVVVTGNPRTDAFVSTARLDEQPFGPCILLALSVANKATNETLVRDSIAAIGMLPSSARLAIKLHPGQGEWNFVKPLVHRAAEHRRIQVLRHEPLDPLLARASVVVIHRSSVAIDALAAQRPVVVHRAGIEPTTADLELSGLRLRITNNARELAEAVSDLSDPIAARRYLRERTEELEHFAGPVDGNSAKRIVELLGTSSS